MNTQDLIAEAIALPVDERAVVIDCLLKSLNPPESEIDKKWAEIAKQRLTELRNEKVKAISGDEVFEKIWKRFN
jgi:putative addiction module component (TIGR02574 family)